MYLYQRPQALSTSSSSHKWLLIPVKLDTCQVLSQLDKWAHDTCECTETEISCNSHVQVSIYLSSYVYCSSFTHPNVVLNLWLPSVEHRRYFWRMFLSIWLKSTRSSLVLDPIDIHCVYKKGFLIFLRIFWISALSWVSWVKCSFWMAHGTIGDWWVIYYSLC